MAEHLSPEYLRYIESPIWKELRETILERDGHRCTKCGHKDLLHVHHLTYERLFDEKLEDLVTLCKLCHDEIHGKRKPAPRVYVEIAKGVLVLKGEKPTKAQRLKARLINRSMRKRLSWNSKVSSKRRHRA